MCLGPEIALLAQTIASVSAVAGTGVGIVGTVQASQASKKAEMLRKQQFLLEKQQKERESIRKFQLARATALSNIQGATGSIEGSAAGGAISAYSATAGLEQGELQQAGRIGSSLFKANADYAQASATAQVGAQIGSFGKDLFASGPEIGRIGATLFG